MARLYVLVRSDLPKNYQSVQAGHAVAQFMIDYPGCWQNETLIYLRVKDEDELGNWNQRFGEIGVNQSPFQEPDLDNEMTALAVGSTLEVERLMSVMKLV